MIGHTIRPENFGYRFGFLEDRGGSRALFARPPGGFRRSGRRARNAGAARFPEKPHGGDAKARRRARILRTGVACHRALCEAAQNAVPRTAWEAIADLIEKSQRRIIGVPGQPDEALRQHEKLLAAVEAGDAERAALAMREHMAAEGALLEEALAASRNGERVGV